MSEQNTADKVHPAVRAWLWVAAVPIAVLILPPLFLVRAWAISKIWNWYAVPLLGAPHLRWVWAFGVLMFFSVLAFRPGPPQKFGWRGYLQVFFNAGLCVALAWAAKAVS